MRYLSARIVFLCLAVGFAGMRYAHTLPLMLAALFLIPAVIIAFNLYAFVRG